MGPFARRKKSLAQTWAENRRQVLEAVEQGSPSEQRRALDVLAQWAAERREDPEILSDYALALDNSGEHTKASRIYQRLVEAHPNHDGLRFNLVAAYAKTGQCPISADGIFNIWPSTADRKKRARQPGVN